MKLYVVSVRKFLILFVSTLGLYSIYWFYKNWRLYKEGAGANIWPLIRGIFSIFFVFSFFKILSLHLRGESNKGRFEPVFYSLVFIFFTISGIVMDVFSHNGIFPVLSSLISLATVPILAWVLYRAQLAINIISGDENGETNCQLALVNFIWIIWGVFLWLLRGGQLYASYVTGAGV